MFSLKISVSFDSDDDAKRFIKSIKSGLSGDFLRSKASVAKRKSVLEINLSTQDKTALRSSLDFILKQLVLFDELNSAN